MDLDPKFRPTLCCDVMQLDERSLGSFDMVWASPVCTEYSRALRRRPRDLAAGDRLVLRTLKIIGNLRPRFWAMENPQTGLLKTRAFMQGLPYSDVCYCKYGFKYKKATRIWHNLPWEPWTAATPSRTASTPRPPSAAPPTAAGTSSPSASCTACPRSCAKRSQPPRQAEARVKSVKFVKIVKPRFGGSSAKPE